MQFRGVVRIGVWSVAAVALLGPIAASPTAGATTVTAPAVARAATPLSEATRMPFADWQARQDTYLAAATAGAMDPGDAESVMAFAERARRDPGFHPDLSQATAATFANLLGAGLNDDFTISTLLTLYYEDHAVLEPSLEQAIRTKLLAVKYWWTEPTAPGTIDKQYYWTENHQILFLANEYLAGQAFPDAVFTNSGMTGRQHMAHARPLLQRWFELRGRYGFSEFLANPYTAITYEGMLSLAEHADAPDLAQLAADTLDMQLVEVASHLHDGVLGSAKGRTYTGDLFDPHGGVTPALILLIFAPGTPPTGSGPAAAMATATRYRPPDVAIRIATTTETGVIRQHQGIPLDPTAPVTANPTPPDGLAFAGDDGLMVWWAMGAQLAWQVAPLSVATIEKYNLWDTPNFQIDGANLLKDIVKGKTTAQLQALAQSLAEWLNPGLLSAVDTYTWRSGDAMLSTAQDWRTGQRLESALVSEATLDREATVFVSLPKGRSLNDPATNGKEDGGYWSGNGAAPRAAQSGDTNVAIYAPQYAAGGPTGPNGYQSFTHAFFPTERFDQVVQQDGWTFGRNGNGYVALWSWRPTHWGTILPNVPQEAGLTKKYELIADGGSDDVWITRMGQASSFAGSPDPFAAFIASVTSHAPKVQPMAGKVACPVLSASALGSCQHQIGDGFLVTYGPTGHAALSFGWAPKAGNPEPPLTVDGTSVALHDSTQRWSSPWATADRNGHYHVSIDGHVLDLTLPVPKAVPPPPTTTTTTPTTPSTTSAIPPLPTIPPATPVLAQPNFTG